MKDLIIADGSYFKIRNIADVNLVSNCEIYLPTENRCLLCQTGFLE